MALPMLAGATECGPSNPLQGLSKRFDSDRGLQQVDIVRPNISKDVTQFLIRITLVLDVPVHRKRLSVRSPLDLYSITRMLPSSLLNHRLLNSTVPTPTILGHFGMFCQLQKLNNQSPTGPQIS
jgi:hypothetical protein